jgi:hypothetical protein
MLVRELIELLRDLDPEREEQGVAEGFSDSSKDYGTDEVTITFDGDIPSKEEIIQYCKKNYGFIPSSIDIEPPSNYKGLENPGIIRVKQGVRRTI